ncbi:sigma-70 family RNA polymerase sigma factor [Lederbergia lenta]|uniref:RNA polymerase sigma factor n=1 Tax=Lederbergia lenta TaxID=1467 RepID=A0A2X4VYD6_LEDLE|nr:sigma-70 family RNA polymerase sigma factor [Lederbergia lenta]MEC2325277.1 sigma-70 family RNA polymerase sigma factor [Lederbergia lenta]SQI55861.1 RNA polymerase sigma-70 factor [Lederbergia lenta]
MKESIESIYNYYFNDIYRFLLSLSRDHHTAEDLVQETFLRAYLHVENNENASIKSWLFTVAHHVFIDYYRKQKRVEVKKQGFFSNLFDKRNTPEETIVIREDIQEIINLLDGIPEKQKYAVLLHDFHELSYSEAAAVMNVSLANFKVILYRGRQAMRRKKGE